MTSSLPNPLPATDIRLVRHLARTGGTVICKCLGCMDSVILLSEAHPLAMDKWTNLFEQANRWHGLSSNQEIRGWKKRGAGYAEVLGLLNARADARGKSLVVREWTHLDYVGAPFVSPPMTPLATQALQDEFALRIVDTVRHPLDHWMSVSRLQTMAEITLEQHLEACAAFAAETQRRARITPAHRIVRYEDFCKEAHEQLEAICETLGIEYDDRWESQWGSYDKITGDTEGGRGNSQDAIAPLSRREPPPDDLSSCRSNDHYLAACSAWVYSPDLSDQLS